MIGGFETNASSYLSAQNNNNYSASMPFTGMRNRNVFMSAEKINPSNLNMGRSQDLKAVEMIAKNDISANQ